MLRLALRGWPIRRKLILVALLASALPVAAATLITYARATVLLREQATALITARADQLAAEIEALHGTYTDMARRLAALPFVATYVGAPEGERAGHLKDVQATMDVYQRSDGNLRSVGVIDRKGRLIASSDPDAVGVDLSHREYVQRALEGETVTSDMFVGIRTSRASVVVAFVTPIREQGEVVGLAAVYVNASAIWELVRAGNGRAGAGSFSVLYDRVGIRVAHSFNDRELFLPASRLPEPVKARLIAGKRFGDDTARLLDDVSPAAEEYRRVVDGANGAPDVFVAHSQANGLPNLAVTRRLVRVPWTLFVLVPESTVTSPITALTLSAAAAGLVIVALALVAATLLSRNIMTPITELEGAAAAMKRGELGTRVEVRAADEIGALANTFNDMASSLQASRDRLEQRVRDRTLELERLNEELRAQQEELRAQKAELNTRAEELQRLDRLKSEFLANMSHELRTPLNAILGFSELVRDGDGGPVSSRQREHLDQVLASGRHLLALINDILDLSKIEAGKLTLARVPVSLREVTAEAHSLVRPQAERRKITVETRIEGADAVLGDPGKIRQILVNLLSNAVKFSQEATTIEVLTRRAGSLVHTEIVDHGPGVDPEIAAKLFQPFVQGESPLVKRHQGTGLGLAISKRLVEAHGGSIGVGPTPGGGATFWFTLPAASTSDTVTNAGGDKGRTVLLVDQQIDDASRRTLEAAGYTLVLFDNGRPVVDVAIAQKPAAIVIDPASARRDAFGALDDLARNAATRIIPVIMRPVVSPATLLAKPVGSAELLAAVDQVVARRKGRTVLAIDDDPRVLSLLDSILSRAGYRVLTAGSGHEGLSLAARNPVDLFIIDLVMPGMSGLEVVDAIAADPGLRERPVIVLTAKDVDETERAALRSKVSALTRKGDLTTDELVACIDRALRPQGEWADDGPCILVADDNDANRELVRTMLERNGYAVISALDGEDAVATARRHLPALVLMDLAMPRKDGYAAARELKADPRTAHVPIVALTALAMSGDEERAFAAGMDGYITKPVDRALLEETVARFVRRAPSSDS